MGFSRQEYRSELPFPSPRESSQLELNLHLLRLLHLQVGSLPLNTMFLWKTNQTTNWFVHNCASLCNNRAFLEDPKARWSCSFLQASFCPAPQTPIRLHRSLPGHLSGRDWLAWVPPAQECFPFLCHVEVPGLDRTGSCIVFLSVANAQATEMVS